MSKKKTDVNPTRRCCGTMQAHFAMLDRFPSARQNQADIEAFTRSTRGAGPGLRTGVIKIPVVVHIVTRNPELVTTLQINKQIAQLNYDYRKKNADVHKVPAAFMPLVADAEIEFVLAKKDPRDKITTGVTRKKTNKIAFNATLDDVKNPATGGAAAWDAERYLNIWVCVLAGGVLGYAQFPGGDPATDGVVITASAFGAGGTARAPFNKGRTATHEVGHYLNLSHIWGESRIPTCSDDDYVRDTPPQFDKHFGTPTFPQSSCNNAPHGDMFMNYMDYVDDVAMFMFTRGQVNRMRAALSGPRSKIGT